MPVFKRTPKDLPSIGAVLGYWKDHARFLDERINFLLDLREPTCWACQWFWDGRYDVRSKAPSWEQLVRAWEKAPLQRCHVVPCSLGGSNAPSNILLMCRECHDLSPNLIHLDFMLDWCKAQSWWERRTKEIREAAASFGIDWSNDPGLDKLTNILKNKRFQRWFMQSAGFHLAQTSKKGGITASTLVAAVLDYSKTVNPDFIQQSLFELE